MALTRAKKTQKVEVLAKELATSTSAIVGTFAKLTVSQDFELRQKVREAGGRYSVLKNKLAARASKGTQIEAALQGLKGVSSVAYTSGDPVALAKALSAWVKDNAEFTFKLGIVDGKVITVDEVQSLATMPAKEEIYAKLLFLINAPATRLATVLNATGRSVALVIDQAVQGEKFTAKGASSPPAPSAEAPAGTATPTVPGAEVPVPLADVPAGVAGTPALDALGDVAPIGVEAAEVPAVAIEGRTEPSADAPGSDPGSAEAEAHGDAVVVEDAVTPEEKEVPGSQGGQEAGS